MIDDETRPADRPRADRRRKEFRDRDLSLHALERRRRLIAQVTIAKRARRKKESKKSRERRRQMDRARYHGLSLEAYRALLARGACDICGRSDRQLGVDHCHATGRVRGLLCRWCDFGLGHFGDDAALMRTARTYLQMTAPTTKER